MPVREPKGRVLVREYMADREFMRTFAPEEREAYLLMALFTDDSGWLDWDLEELAAALYRFESPDAREANLRRYSEHFIAAGRLKVYKCGHAVMPKVANRPRGMTREYAVQEAHRTRCGSSRTAVRKHNGSSLPPVQSIPNRSISSQDNGKPSLPTRARPRGGAARSAGEILAEYGYHDPRVKEG